MGTHLGGRTRRSAGRIGFERGPKRVFEAGHWSGGASLDASARQRSERGGQLHRLSLYPGIVRELSSERATGNFSQKLIFTQGIT